MPVKIAYKHWGRIFPEVTYLLFIHLTKKVMKSHTDKNANSASGMIPSQCAFISQYSLVFPKL